MSLILYLIMLGCADDLIDGLKLERMIPATDYLIIRREKPAKKIINAYVGKIIRPAGFGRTDMSITDMSGVPVVRFETKKELVFYKLIEQIPYYTISECGYTYDIINIQNVVAYYESKND